MQIEHWAILAFIVWLIVAIKFIKACIKSDKRAMKAIEHDHIQNIKETMLVPDDIPEEELEILCCEQPFIYLPEGNF